MVQIACSIPDHHLTNNDRLTVRELVDRIEALVQQQVWKLWTSLSQW